MTIDTVSTQLVQLALYVETLRPGTVSEIWLAPELIEKLKQNLPTAQTIDAFISRLETDITTLSDERRKQYLSQTVHSLKYQLQLKDAPPTNLEEFTQNCFGITIPRATDAEVQELENQIQALESQLGKSRHEVLKETELTGDALKEKFLGYLAEAKVAVANKLQVTFPDNDEFTFTTVRNESWSAFNKHLAPFHSELIINLDYPVTWPEARFLAFHEGYGGHHTELSLKDRLLVEEGRGEHGIVITYSPQTFISEAIAVNSQVFFDTAEQPPEAQLNALYSRLAGGVLLNKASYLFYQDGKSKDEIGEYLHGFDITPESKTFILNFATDTVYGVYTLVYRFAGKYLLERYERATDREVLLNEIFTLPTTPDML